MTTTPQPIQQTDPAEQILRSAQGLDDGTRANAWDAFHQSKDEDDLTNHLQKLNIPQEVKASLWDAKHSMSAPAPTSRTEGLRVPGNLDLSNRPKVQNPDGSYSQELSFSRGTDKGEVLVPRVVNGKMLSQEEAWQHYLQTGEHMGIFDTPEHADYYANLVHNRNTTGYKPTTQAPPEEGWFHQNIVAPLASAAKRVKDAVLEGEAPGMPGYEINQYFNPTPAPPAATDQEAIQRLKARNASTDPQQIEIEKDLINKMRSDRQFEARNAKIYAEGDPQLIHPEKLLPPSFAKNNPVLYGLFRIAGSLTTKENAELLMASGGLGAVGATAATGPALAEKLVSYAPRLVSAYFAGMMGIGAASYIPGLVQAKKDYDAALASGNQAKADDILWHAKEQTTEAAASAYMSYAAAYHASTGHPDPIGKTVSDAYDMAKSGAVVGAKGAAGLAGDAASAAWEKATSVQKLVSGKANSVPDAILAASNVPQKLRPAHLEKIKDVENDLDYILNNNPNIVDPATAAKAIRDNNQANENSMLAKAGATRGSTDAVVPNFEKRLSQRLDKYFADNAGKFGTPEEVAAAKKDIIDRTMQRIQAGVDPAGNPIYTPRSPNLFEAENIRQGLNIDAKPRFGDNAKPTTDAYKNGAFEAANFMREVIDEAYHDKGVEGVKEFRQKEAKLIDVAKALDDAQGKALERGEPGWGKAIWSKFGRADAAIGIATGFLTGSIPAGIVTAIPGIVAHKALQERTSPIGNINRAVDLAAENPGAKATEVTVKPPTTPPMSPAAPAAPVAPPPPTNPTAPAPAGAVAQTPPMQPFQLAPIPPGINHKLYSALSSHYGKVIGSVPFEDLENRFMNDVAKATETGGALSDRQQKLLETVNDAKAEQRLTAEKEQKAAVDKAQKDAAKAASDQAKAAEKARKEQEKEAEKIAKEKEEKAAAGLNTNVAAPFNTEDEIALPAKYVRLGYTGPRLRAHEAGHMAMISEFGHPTGDVISHNHAQNDSGAAAEARWDKSKFQDENGDFSPELIAQRLPELVATFYGGPIAEELVHGIPMETNPGASGDIRRLNGIMKTLGLDPTERGRIAKAGEMAAREALTTPGVADIIRRYTNQRQAGIGDDLHMTPETVGKMVEEVKHARGGGGTTAGTEGKEANEPNANNEEPDTNEAGESSKQAKPGGKGERKGEAKGTARTAGKEGADIGRGREPRTEINANPLKTAINEIEKVNKESKADIAVKERAGRIRITDLASSEKGQGHASKLLKSVTDIADKRGVTLELTSSPYGDEKTRLDHDQLKAFYERNGFVDEPGYDPALGYMIREPKSKSDLKTNISHEGMTGLLESRRSEENQPTVPKAEHPAEPKLENRLAHREEALRAEHDTIGEWKERVLALEKRLAALEEPVGGQQRLTTVPLTKRAPAQPVVLPPIEERPPRAPIPQSERDAYAAHVEGYPDLKKIVGPNSENKGVGVHELSDETVPK